MSFITDPNQLQQLDLTILDEADRSTPLAHNAPRSRAKEDM
jgi:hypothetical protein